MKPEDAAAYTSSALNALIANTHHAIVDTDTFIKNTYDTFLALGETAPQPDVPTIVHRPQEQISASITPDALVSFEDGKSYKSLKRHLTGRGLTPETYRAKHGLGPNYPMVAESYAAKRSELARSMGLGKKRSTP